MSAWEGSEWQRNQEEARKNPNKLVDITLAQRITELVNCHGSLRLVGQLLDIDFGYLAKLRNGDKRDPSEAVLNKLGLQRHVFYRRK